MKSLVRDLIAKIPFVLQRQVIHGQVDAGEISPGNVEIARLGAAAAKDDRVEIAAQVADLDVVADVGVRHELDPLFLHHFDPAIDEAFFELEVRDAVHQQPADAVGPLEDGDGMTRLIELRSGRKARRAGARRPRPSSPYVFPAAEA